MHIKQYINKFAVKPVGFFLLSLGIDPRKFKNIIYYPWFFNQLANFLIKGGKVTSVYPIVSDRFDSAGNLNGHYFTQDLHVAKIVFKSNPYQHLDIGSRLDGFVAHVASFRDIYVMDIRDVKIKDHPNIKFVKQDLMNLENNSKKFDSISCLHALEHFGLGRYGDPIDPNGYRRGLANIIDILEPSGYLYLSVPISDTTRVAFNAHREFTVDHIPKLDFVESSLELINLDLVDDSGNLHIKADINAVDVRNCLNGLAIYTFKKHA
jgi:SAM-dependent methyltransferase